MYLYGRDDPASKSDHWGERVSDDVEFVVCTAACALAVEYYYRRTNPEASRLRRTVVSSIICCPFCIDEAYGDSCEETSWEEMKKAIEQRIQELEPKTQRWLPEEVLKQLEWQLLRNKNELLPLTTPECSNPVQNLLEHLGNFITGRDNRFRMR